MNGTITMDSDDWTRIEGIVNNAVKPINDRLDKLPCSINSTDIINLKAQREAEKEQKKDQKDSKDWLLKVLLAGVAIIGLLQGIGFFQSLTSK